MGAEAYKTFVRRYPAIAQRVESVWEKRQLSCEWRSETENPDRVLDRWVEGLVLSEDMAIAISGVGDGSHILRILENLPDGCHLFCSEPSCESFAGFLDTELADSLLSDSRVFWGVGELDDLFYASMEQFPLLEVRDAQAVIFSPLYNSSIEYYSSFFLQFARQLDYWRKLYGTNVVSSGHWQSNTLENLKSLIAAPDVGQLAGSFKGVPMIVASAGPSLDESLDFISKHQDQAIVVAGNSSIRALRNAGIQPHFVLAADPNESTDLGFEGVDLGETILVCPFIVYPKVVTRFVGRAITWSYNSELVCHLRSRVGKGDGAYVTEQGTVSACAFDLAKIFGCSSLYFVGQDLAVKTDGQSHASDSFYSDAGLNRTNLEKCRWLPGNTIEKVPVEEKLFVYVKTFEQMARNYSGFFELVNLSRLGTKIEGIPYLSLEEAERKMSKNNPVEIGSNWEKVTKACSTQWIAWRSVEGELAAMRSYTQKVCSLALKGGLLLELETGDSAGVIEKVERMRAELESAISAVTPFKNLLESGQLKLELLDHRRTIRELAREGKGDQETETLKSYFWAIAEGSYHLLNSLKSVKGESD